MCGSVLDLCRSTAASGRGFTLDPQQLQTAMSLYTSDVCALVMVEETGPVTSSGRAFNYNRAVACDVTKITMPTSAWQNL